MVCIIHFTKTQHLESEESKSTNQGITTVVCLPEMCYAYNWLLSQQLQNKATSTLLSPNPYLFVRINKANFFLLTKFKLLLSL